MSQLILIGTDGCHLCELAESLLQAISSEYQVREIMDEPNWQARFAMKIPVIFDLNTQKYLAWPFDKEQIIDFIGFERPLLNS
jgi:glutaredoxin